MPTDEKPQRREKLINIRVSIDEFATLRKYAESAGYSTNRGPGVSSYLRDLGLRRPLVTPAGNEDDAA